MIRAEMNSSGKECQSKVANCSQTHSSGFVGFEVLVHKPVFASEILFLLLKHFVPFSIFISFLFFLCILVSNYDTHVAINYSFVIFLYGNIALCTVCAFCL